METAKATAKPGKAPLPGYRFLFMTLGAFLSAGALWGGYDMLSGRHPDGGVSGRALLLAAGWLVAGVSCILFSHRLRKGNLTERHWMFGLGLMIGCAVLIGLLFTAGYIFLFMALIWTDSDVKTNFRWQSA